MGPLWLLPGGLCVCVRKRAECESAHMYVCVFHRSAGGGEGVEGGGGEIYLSEQRRTGDEEGGRRSGGEGRCAGKAAAEEGVKKKTGKRQMQKREIYCRVRMEHIKKRLKGLEREEEVSDAE